MVISNGSDVTLTDNADVDIKHTEAGSSTQGGRGIVQRGDLTVADKSSLTIDTVGSGAYKIDNDQEGLVYGNNGYGIDSTDDITVTGDSTLEIKGTQSSAIYGGTSSSLTVEDSTLNIFGYTGPINQLIQLFGGDSINFFGEAKLFQPLVIGTDIWKGFGYNTVVYLAAILGVDKSLYEAAAVDGAGRFKRIWHVTLPGIRTTVALLAILSLGNILNAGFDQIYNLYNPLVYSTGDIIDTWVYRAGLQNLQYSLATAVGLFKSVISVILIALGYWLADKFTGYKLF